MDSTDAESWQEVLVLTYHQLVQQFIVFAPKLLIAAVLLVVGWLVALLLAKLTRIGLEWLNKLLSRMFAHLLPKAGLTGSGAYTRFVSRVVFWLVLLFFVAASANSLGLDLVSSWMGELLLYLPQFVVGVIIIVAGYVLSTIARLMTASAAHSVGFSQAQLLGRSVQLAVLITAVVIGIEQLGINIQFLTQFFIVITGVLAAGFSLAFALGARQLVANIIGAQQAQKLFQVGDEIAVADVRGVLIEVTGSALILETSQGRTAVPAHLLMRHVSHVNAPTASKPAPEASK